jgi:hypothetical protein
MQLHPSIWPPSETVEKWFYVYAKCPRREYERPLLSGHLERNVRVFERAKCASFEVVYRK